MNLALRILMTLALILSVCGHGLCQATDPRPELKIVQWNVENLFDSDDDPRNEGDDEFLPDSWQRWSAGRYAVKLAHLARVLGALKGDIVCLEEIENRRVLDDLAAVLREQHGLNYSSIIHREGPDHRGIDVAILSRIKHVSARWITPVDEQRDILIAHFRPHDSDLVLFVNHWKSRWGGREKSEGIRCEQARAVRSEILRLLQRNPAAAIVVAGDFNDDPSDPSVLQELQSSSDRPAVLSDVTGTMLYNLQGELEHGATGTFYYRHDGSWNFFDQISVSRAMLERSAAGGWGVKPHSFAVFKDDANMLEDGVPKPFRPLRDPVTGKLAFSEGYSDHLPVTVVLQLVGPR